MLMKIPLYLYVQCSHCVNMQRLLEFFVLVHEPPALGTIYDQP